MQIKAFRKIRKSLLVRQKTDSTDAQLVAEFCHMHNPSPWSPGSPEAKELYEINRRIDFLKTELNRVTNCLDKKNLSKLILKSINSAISFINKQIEKLEQAARKIIDSDPTLSQNFKRLTAINEIGKKTAIAVICDIPDVSNFQKSGQFAAFVGITPLISDQELQ